MYCFRKVNTYIGVHFLVVSQPPENTYDADNIQTEVTRALKQLVDSGVLGSYDFPQNLEMGQVGYMVKDYILSKCVSFS